MKNRHIAVAGVLFGTALLTSFFFLQPKSAETTNDTTPTAVSNPSEAPELETDLMQPSGQPSSEEYASSAITQSQIELVLDEISTRFDLDQSEEALNELNGLIGRYDSLTHSEKRDVLDAYARYFREHSLYGDAIFFYEEILKLPELKQPNRLAILQLLAILATNSEDWNGFLAYYDRYFDAGGEYNWVVTRSLANAYQRLEDFDAAGDSVLLHFDTGIHPEYDGSEEQYQRRYARYESIPLNMTNDTAALTLALAMVDQFDMPGNWRVLAELYQLRGDGLNYSNTMESAQEKGYVDNSGIWSN